MSLPVIVTRAEPGARQTAARLIALGFQVIVSPALVLEANPDAEALHLEGYDGIVFTSANGVRFFCDAYSDRSLPAWCVGPATTAAAEAAGFGSIFNANGNSDDLAQLVLSAPQPPERLLHVANEAAAGNLAERLRMAGLTVDFAPLYRARQTGALSEDAVTALEAGAFVLIHSAKGAEGFLTALNTASLEQAHIVAVSETAAAPLKGAGAARLDVADRPNEDGLMKRLQCSVSAL